jgi:hypothetical protein
MKILINNQSQDLSYAEICKRLKILAEVKFVEINRAGTIDFTVGKPDEIAYLIRHIADAGMRMSSKFYKWAQRQGFGCPLMYYDEVKAGDAILIHRKKAAPPRAESIRIFFPKSKEEFESNFDTINTMAPIVYGKTSLCENIVVFTFWDRGHCDECINLDNCTSCEHMIAKIIASPEDMIKFIDVPEEFNCAQSFADGGCTWISPGSTE